MLHTSKTRFVSLLGALNYVAKVGTIEYDVARVHVICIYTCHYYIARVHVICIYTCHYYIARVHVICIYTCHYYIAGFADDVLHMTYKSSIK